MNANTSVVLGYSELIDSHRAGLQMERGFLTVFLRPAWEHMTLSLPHSGPLTKPFFFTLLAPRLETMALGRGRGVGGRERERGRAFSKKLGR